MNQERCIDCGAPIQEGESCGCYAGSVPMADSTPTESVQASEEAANEGPAGSGGWQPHAEQMERERNYWRARAQTAYEHQRGEVWYWQGDGEDHLESMAHALPVVIRAEQLRELLAAKPEQHEHGIKP